MVKCFIFNDSKLQIPYYYSNKKIQSIMTDASLQASKGLKNNKKAHAIYAIKEYDINRNLIEIKFYIPPVLLNDEEFHQMTQLYSQASDGRIQIYAHHK